MITDFDRRATRGGSEERWQHPPDESSREYPLTKYNERVKRFLRASLGHGTIERLCRLRVLIVVNASPSDLRWQD